MTKYDKKNKDAKLEEILKCYFNTKLPIANYNNKLIKKNYCMRRWSFFYKISKYV